jgi:sterol 24-C-methyltransferase
MAMTQWNRKAAFWWYRLSTTLQSLRYLYFLPPEKVANFLNSYAIYDHDWRDENELIKAWGADYYTQVKARLIDYYSILNYLCAVGQVEKMYIPPALDLSRSIIENQVLFEQRICRDLGIVKGERVMDLGCGRGRVAAHVASTTGVQVVGINIDPSQLESAKRFALGTGLERQCQYQRWDHNDRPFPFADNSFDHVYQIQALSLSKSLPDLFSELHRIMKPGGKFASLDWVRLDQFDPTNPVHADLMKRIKPLIGAIGTPSVEELEDQLSSAGFEVLTSENPSIDGLQAPLIENADRFFTRVARSIDVLARWRVLPVHFKLLFDRLTKDGAAFVEADRLRLVTTSYYIVARKKA